MLRTLQKVLDGVLVALNHISVIAILLTALWIFADVVGRFVFHHPIPGTTELVEEGESDGRIPCNLCKGRGMPLCLEYCHEQARLREILQEFRNRKGL